MRQGKEPGRNGQKRRGRRLGASRTARAAVIYKAMAACGVGIQALADRLGIARSTLRRWLDGESRATAAFSLDALWDALGITGERRERMSARLASTSPERSLAQVDERGVVAAGSPERARDALVTLLRAELHERHISARELARRLHVAPATVTRFLGGAVTRSRLRIEAICDAIGLCEGSMRRRELLRLATAGALALSVGAPVMLRTRGLDFDEVARRMDGLERPRAAGCLQEAWDAAQEPELRGMIRRARALERDGSARAIRFRYDFVVATMRKQRAPWTVSAEHATRVIEWYKGVQHELLRFAPPAEVSHELAQIHERIAPLYRQKGAYDDSVWSFDFALRQRTERAEDMALAVHLWRNRAHI